MMPSPFFGTRENRALLLLLLFLVSLSVDIKSTASATSVPPTAAMTQQKKLLHREEKKKEIEDDNNNNNDDYLYRSMEPPSKAYPVVDYYFVNRNNDDGSTTSAGGPDFLTSSEIDHLRVVEFYSPTCPHCQAFASEYVFFANYFITNYYLTTTTTSTTRNGLFSSSSPTPKFYGISCLVHKTICRQENIRNYPTIKIIPAYHSSSSSKDNNNNNDDAVVELKDYQLHLFKLIKIIIMTTKTNSQHKQQQQQDDDDICLWPKLREATTTTTTTKPSSSTTTGSNRLRLRRNKKDGLLLKSRHNHQKWKNGKNNKERLLEHSSDNNKLGGIQQRGSSVAQPSSSSSSLPSSSSVVSAAINNNDDALQYFRRLRTKQEIFTDAYLSFVMTLRDSIFVVDEGPLPKDKTMKLRNFLRLLQDSLPPTWKIIHTLLNKLLLDLNRIVYHERVWQKIIEKFVPSSSSTLVVQQQRRQAENDGSTKAVVAWSPSCRRGRYGNNNNGYTCGLWTLLHIVTTGVTEYNRHVVVAKDDERSYFDMVQVADTIKDFIETFFLCEECTRHFVKEYDDCAYRRCERLVQLADSSSGGGDATNVTSVLLRTTKSTQQQQQQQDMLRLSWIQLPLWLVDTHNGVNARLQKRKQIQQQEVMWPSTIECPACWLKEDDDKGKQQQYNELIMYKYLRLTYWPEDAESLAFKKELEDTKGGAVARAKSSATTTSSTQIKDSGIVPLIHEASTLSTVKTNREESMAADVVVKSTDKQGKTALSSTKGTKASAVISSDQANKPLVSNTLLEGAAYHSRDSDITFGTGIRDEPVVTSTDPVEIESAILALLIFVCAVLFAKKKMQLQRLYSMSGITNAEHTHGL